MFVRICDFKNNRHQLHNVVKVDRVYIDDEGLGTRDLHYLFIEPNVTYKVLVKDVKNLEIYDSDAVYSLLFNHKTQSPISLF